MREHIPVEVDSSGRSDSTAASLIARAVEFARAAHAGDATGHDWPHVERVWRMARRLAREEGADALVCELAALLHDVADEKLQHDTAAAEAHLRAWLDETGMATETRERVWEIIATLSFKGGGGPAEMRTLEGTIVRDADRLDALGAIGIARVFVYSGAIGQAMHDPDLAPREGLTREEYRGGKSTALNHFYEKLFKLKAGIKTETARRIAVERETFMREYVERFLREWSE